MQDTEDGRISTTEFTLLKFTYDAVEDAIKDRRLQLERAERHQATRTDAATTASPKLAASALKGS